MGLALVLCRRPAWAVPCQLIFVLAPWNLPSLSQAHRSLCMTPMPPVRKRRSIVDLVPYKPRLLRLLCPATPWAIRRQDLDNQDAPSVVHSLAGSSCYEYPSACRGARDQRYGRHYDGADTISLWHQTLDSVSFVSCHQEPVSRLSFETAGKIPRTHPRAPSRRSLTLIVLSCVVGLVQTPDLGSFLSVQLWTVRRGYLRVGCEYFLPPQRANQIRS
jgi:hypothetical protein